jgi:ABC-type lipoprotein release transport system permease subunit
MAALRLWLPAEWRRRWLALLALAVLIAVGGGAATALWAGARRAGTAYDRFQAATGSANITAQFRSDGKRADADPTQYTAGATVVPQLAAVPGVERAWAEAWWAVEPESLINPDAPEAFMTGAYTSAGQPFATKVVAGTMPGPDRPDTVIVNEEAARQFHWTVGTHLRLRTVSPAHLTEWAGNDGSLPSMDSFDGPAIDASVAAIVRTEEDFSQTRTPGGFVSESFAAAYGDKVAKIVPLVHIRAAPGEVSAVMDRVRPILDHAGFDAFPAERTDTAVAPTVSVEVTTLRIAALVAALAALVVVAQAAGRTVSAIGEQHHVRAALGMTRRARTAGTALAVLPGVVLGALGVPLVAGAASGLFPRGVARQAEPHPGIRLDAAALAIGLGATLVAAAVLVLVVAALDARPARPARPGSSFLTGTLLGRPSMSLAASFATKPSGRGRRAPFLAGTAVLGVALGVGAIVVVSTIESSRTHLTGTPRLFGSPSAYALEGNGEAHIPGTVQAALAVDGVDALTQRIRINDDAMNADGPHGSRQVEPITFEPLRGGALPQLAAGRLAQGADEVALGRGTARDLGVRIGQRVSIVPVGATEPIQLTVTGLVLPGGAEDQSQAFVVAPGTLDTLLCEGQALPDCHLAYDLFADAHTPAARAALERLGFQAATPPPSVERLEQAGALPWYLAAFLCLLGAAGLLHELVTTLRRRRNDLAVARALGLSRRRAASVVTWQAVFTALAGTAVGLLLGAIVGRLVWRSIAANLGVLVSTSLPVLATAALIVAVVLVASLVALPPRWHAERLPLARMLRVE